MKTTLKAFGIGLVFQWALFSAFVITGFHEVLLEHGGFWTSWVAASLVLAGSFTAVRIGSEATSRRLKVAATTKEYYRAMALLLALCALASFLSIITLTALFHIQGDRRVVLPDIGLLANSFSLITLVVLYPAYALGRLMIIPPSPTILQGVQEQRVLEQPIKVITHSARGIYKRLDHYKDTPFEYLGQAPRYYRSV